MEVKEVPKRWAPNGALHSFKETSGLVTAGAYHKGDMLQSGMLESPPGLQSGYREVAIIVDAETGVAGKISSGETVDIIATREDPNSKVQWADVVVENAVILDVGVATDIKEKDESGNFTDEKGVPVTFALSTQDALKVAYAESFAVKLRLSLRGEGDDSALGPDSTQYGGGSAPAAPAPETPATGKGGN